jgi:hypothetical protein
MVFVFVVVKNAIIKYIKIEYLFSFKGYNINIIRLKEEINL